MFSQCMSYVTKLMKFLEFFVLFGHLKSNCESTQYKNVFRLVTGEIVKQLASRVSLLNSLGDFRQAYEAHK